MKSILTCKYRNGICETCGGQYVKHYINHEFNYGYIAVLIFNVIVVQSVLSSKHHQVTTSKEYVIPDQLRKYLRRRFGIKRN
jgi:hypothetical protein